MPTYEYMCTACQHEWEAFQSIKDEPLKKCPKCHKRTAKRLVSLGGGFILKGGGWYADLYSSTGSKSSGSSGSSRSSGSSSKGSGGSSSGSSSGGSAKAASSSSSGGSAKAASSTASTSAGA